MDQQTKCYICGAWLNIYDAHADHDFFEERYCVTKKICKKCKDKLDKD